jgi:hypothetical protein
MPPSFRPFSNCPFFTFKFNLNFNFNFMFINYFHSFHSFSLLIQMDIYTRRQLLQTLSQQSEYHRDTTPLPLPASQDPPVVTTPPPPSSYLVPPPLLPPFRSPSPPPVSDVVSSSSSSSSDDDETDAEVNVCCSCGTVIKWESQICGKCARDGSIFNC